MINLWKYYEKDVMLRASPRVPLVEQELLIHPEYLSSPLVLLRFMLLLDVFRIEFLSFCPFSFGHCVVCPTSNYGQMELPKILNNRIESFKSDIDNFQATFYMCEVKYIGNFQICAAIYQLLLHMVFTSRNWFVIQGPVAIILISWNVIFIWETG